MKKSIMAVIAFIIAVAAFSQQAGSFTDNRDGKTYKTVTIGNLEWMAENLAFKVEDKSYAYDDNQDNVSIYGYLYKWKTSLEVCPTGWRLPSLDEFKALLELAGGKGEDAFKGLLPGGSTGFSALYGGWFAFKGQCKDLGERAYFWTSTNAIADKSFCMYVDAKREKATVFSIASGHGHSVRCVKDTK
jgi:uncharacterized protein (TIGR02145 family)